MVDLGKCLDNLKFDHRMVDWNVRQGTLSKDEWKKHVSSLPDLANQSEKLNFEFETDGSGNGRYHDDLDTQ